MSVKTIYYIATDTYDLSFDHLLYPGACDGMTYEEIEEQFPEEFERREKDKLAYRYPRYYSSVILST